MIIILLYSIIIVNEKIILFVNFFKSVKNMIKHNFINQNQASKGELIINIHVKWIMIRQNFNTFPEDT